jgi:hypothetical protein
MKARKILEKARSGSKNIRFEELQYLIEAFGFTHDRTKGSHHSYEHPALPRPFPIQSIRGKAKPYQVRQFLKLVDQYQLKLPDENKDKEA